MTGQVAGKVALVTGGASGIGEACSVTLAREGASVVVTDIDAARGNALVEQIAADGGKAIFFQQDVTSETRWPEVIAAAEKAFGGLHILVANAGIGIMVPILEMTLADWQRQNAINLDGVFLTVKYGIPAMRRTGRGGSVIMMSSIAGLRGSPGLAGYSMTKGGVRLFAKSVALECALAKDGIRVNSVHPGVIDTPIWNKIPTGATGAHNNKPIDPRARSLWMIPIGELGTAQDIADGVLFLASDASKHMTGSELVIDGGIMSVEKQIADFGKRAQDGKLTIEELTGGTFSISNGGVFGSMLSTPIINPPQSAILGVHATKERAVVENGQIVIRPMNYFALSYDHRIIDGREAVLALVAMKEALEDPARMLLDI